MRIVSLALENFMPYRNKTEIDFSVPDNARVLLFMGHNGAGKTSVFHAIRWCLYGFSEKGGQKLGVELLFNQASRESALSDPNVKMSVTLVWENEGHTYELTRRAWFEAGSPTLTTSEVLRVDGGDAYSAAAIPGIVRRFLPKEISHLFLFDGESLQAFQNMNSDGNSASFIKQQVESTLSIPAIKEAHTFLSNRATAEAGEAAKDHAAGTKLKNLQTQLMEKKKVADLLQIAIDEAQNNKLEEQRKIDAASDALGDVEEFIRLEAKLTAAKNQQQLHEDNVEMHETSAQQILASNPWLSLRDRLQTLLDGALKSQELDTARDQTIGALRGKIQMLDDNQGTKKCTLCGSVKDHADVDYESKKQTLKQEIETLQNTPKSDAASILNRIYSIGFSANAMSQYATTIEAINTAKGALALQKQNIMDLNNELAGFEGSGADTSKLVEDFKQASKMVAFWHSQHREKTDFHTIALNEITSKQNEIKKIGTISPQKQLTLNCYLQLKEIFALSIEEYTARTRESVEAKASSTFLQILSGEDFSGVSISDTYGARALKDGKPAQLISQGQETALSVALLDGLIRTAMPGGEGFVLMDSPSGSLDEPNRKNFFSWAGQSQMRVSVFVHSGEFKEDSDRQHFGNNIGRAYRVTAIEKYISKITEEH